MNNNTESLIVIFEGPPGAVRYAKEFFEAFQDEDKNATLLEAKKGVLPDVIRDIIQQNFLEYVRPVTGMASTPTPPQKIASEASEGSQNTSNRGGPCATCGMREADHDRYESCKQFKEEVVEESNY